MAFDNDQRNEIEMLIFEKLPCATNKTCKEIVNLRKQIEKIDVRTWLILAGILISIGLQIARSL